MDAVTLLKERRSVRKYKDEVVSKEILLEILELANRAPSWKNYQIARYNIVQDETIIKRLATEGVLDFIYNKKVLEKAKNIVVISYEKGKSGTFDSKNYVTSKTDWEVFDAGIATHQFCLAARAKGVETVIFGVIDDQVISKLVNVPENEIVATVVVFGYPDDEPKLSSRKPVSEIARFL